MPQLKVQNLYNTTITEAGGIPASGDCNFTVATPPTNPNGFIIISPENALLREIMYYHNVSGNTISVRAENRFSPKAHAVTETVKMNDVAEIFNTFSDMISQAFYVEKTGGLTVRVWGGYVYYNGNPVSVPDTNLTLANNTTNYIKYDYPTNTFSVDTTNAGNIKAQVVTLSGAITSIGYRTAKESYIDFTVALTGALPNQSGQAGKALLTDGTNVSWGTPNLPRTIGTGKGLDVDQATGVEVFRDVEVVTSIESDDIIRVRDADGKFNEITGANFLSGIGASAHPIGSVRYSSVANLFGSGYELRSTATLATTDAWVAKATMGTARKGSAVGVISDKMYLAGGSNDASGAFNTTEEYNFATNTWSSKATMPAARVNAFHGVVSGKLYVIGGSSDVSSISAHQNTNYKYDPVGNSWATKTNMGVAQSDGASGVYNGRIYCFGGTLNGSSTALNTVQYYDPVSNTFTTGLAVITAAKRRCHMHGVSIGNKFYLGGGTDTAGTAQNTFYEYDFPGNTWSTKTNLPTTIFAGQFASAVVEGETKVFSLLGYNGTSNINAVYEYSPTNNNWTNRSTSSPVTTREAMAATYNNKIYVSGGNGPTNTNTEYTPIKTKYEYERVS